MSRLPNTLRTQNGASLCLLGPDLGFSCALLTAFWMGLTPPPKYAISSLVDATFLPSGNGITLKTLTSWKTRGRKTLVPPELHWWAHILKSCKGVSEGQPRLLIDFFKKRIWNRFFSTATPGSVFGYGTVRAGTLPRICPSDEVLQKGFKASLILCLFSKGLFASFSLSLFLSTLRASGFCPRGRGGATSDGHHTTVWKHKMAEVSLSNNKKQQHVILSPHSGPSKHLLAKTDPHFRLPIFLGPTNHVMGNVLHFLSVCLHGTFGVGTWYMYMSIMVHEQDNPCIPAVAIHYHYPVFFHYQFAL